MSSIDFKEESELDLEEVVGLVEGTVADIKDFVSGEDLSEEDINKLIEAEEAGKDRDTAVNFLKRKKNDLNVENHVENVKEELKENHGSQNIGMCGDAAEIDIGHLKMVLTATENSFLVLDIGNHRIPLKNRSLNDIFRQTGLNLVSGRSKTVQGFTDLNIESSRQNNPAVRSFQNYASEESGQRARSQNNNTSLERQSNFGLEPIPQNSQNDSSSGYMDQENSSLETNSPEKSPREELENELRSKFNLDDGELKGKTLSELKSLKDDLYRRKSLKNELKNKYGLEDSDVDGKDLEELRDLRDRLGDKAALRQEIKDKFGVNPGERSLEELKEFKENLMSIEDKKEELKKRFDVKEDRLEGMELEGLKDLEERLEEREKKINRLRSYGYEKEDLQKKEYSYLEDELKNIKEKKELIKELDVDFNDKNLKNLDISQLRAMKSEKKEREQIIDELTGEGLDEESLRNSSTKDLRKLKSEMLAPDVDQQKNTNSKDISEEEINEMEKQAEEELHMLMGVVEDEENDEAEKKEEHSIGKLKGLKNEFNGLINTEDEENTSEEDIREEKVRKLLKEYKESKNHVKKAVKTAQVMKGYVEYKLGVNRELTYQELSERIREISKDQDNGDLATLADFFGKIHQQIYSGNVYVENIDEVIETSARVIEGSKE